MNFFGFFKYISYFLSFILTNLKITKKTNDSRIILKLYEIQINTPAIHLDNDKWVISDNEKSRWNFQQ